MALPTCQCISGRPPFDRLADIFCALSQIDLACVIPTLLSATADGDEVTLVFSEEVTGTDGFSVTVDGGGVVINSITGEGTTTYTITLEVALVGGETVLLDYAPGNVQSGPECPLAEFFEFPVTNNTGVDFVYLRPGGVDGYFRPGGVDTYIRP